ncbi:MULTISPECIES: hypothetical protein [unclassified Streptomyces]|uniref:hypothetical protein n=1 Tax=unclassified Streptomyces TaxID=2593676 RepID=UPI0022706993|nr:MULTISPECIES: hypothetical protein [unclassified Streptomyces]MCY0924434.1 hypothetical protein [Streptomyces sp. H27-G5]MCY0963447.1 hypothetical protein [Streptomyces sp. H27-H5]
MAFESRDLNIRANIENIPPDDEGLSVDFGDAGAPEPYLARVSDGKATAPHLYTGYGSYTITATGTTTGTKATTEYHAEGEQLGLTVDVGTGVDWNKAGATVTGLSYGATASVNFGHGDAMSTSMADLDGVATITPNAFIYPEERATYNAVATATGHPDGADTVIIRIADPPLIATVERMGEKKIKVEGTGIPRAKIGYRCNNGDVTYNAKSSVLDNGAFSFEIFLGLVSPRLDNVSLAHGEYPNYSDWTEFVEP